MKSVFLSRSLFLFVFFLLIEQGLVASSTFWISKLAHAITSGTPLSPWLPLFLVSLTLVYLPTSLRTYYLNSAKLCAMRRYVGEFSERFNGLADYCRSQQLKSERQPYLNSESWLVIDETLDFWSQFLTIVLNVLLNVASFGWIIDRSFLFAYLASLPLIVACVALSTKTIQRQAGTAQVARTGMVQVLTQGWDAILVGNRPSFQLWQRKFGDSHSKFSKATLRSIRSIEIATDISMGISLVPILATLVWLMVRGQSDIGIQAVLVATLPRQIQTIQNISDIVQYLMKWNAVKARLSGLLGALQRPRVPGKYVGRVSPNQLNIVSENSIHGVFLKADGTIDLAGLTAGRWTIRGPNGSGKSTLLYKIKALLGERAILVPTHTDIPFESTENREFSTGQKLQAIIGEIRTYRDHPVILLDEWDANLDPIAATRVSQAIDELASSGRCVVEIRHRTDSFSQEVPCPPTVQPLMQAT